MLKNWRLTCWLASPLCGEPPAIDSILEWELSKRLGSKHCKKVTRDTPLSEIDRPGLPIAKRTISGHDIYASSNPIIPHAPEWVDHQSKRIDTSVVSSMLAPEHRRNLVLSSGDYKMRYVPLRIRAVDRIVWFLRCDKQRCADLLRSIVAVGQDRATGYGIVSGWSWDEVDSDCSIFADNAGEVVLNKTIPLGDEAHLAGVSGYRKGFGGGHPPYWHPDTQMEIAIPC